MAGRDEMMRRQRALADFGDFVLDHEDLDAILTEGCRLIAEALHCDLAKVLEIENEAGEALVRAGVGWRAGIIGRERLSLAERSSEAYAIDKTEPVITNDIAQETRFDFPRFLLEHGVVALVNVPILLPGRRPWGVLQVDARRPREFDQDDIEFLKTYSMVLGPVIDRLRVAAEREEARREVDERESRLRTVLEGVGKRFYVLDRDWRFLFASRSALEVWGKTEEELIGRPLQECFPMAEGGAAYEAHQRVMAGGKAETFETISPVLGRWIEVHITHAPDGGLSVALRDIDERKQADAALRESQERYRAILDSALDYAIFTTDPNGLIETWSPGAESVFGWSADEAIGQHVRVTFVPEDREQGVPEKELGQARETGVAANVRWHQRKDGGRVFIEGSTRRMSEAGPNPRGFLKVGQDVTQRRELEEQQKVLVAELQHRTRNLIGVVRSMADKTARTSQNLADFRQCYGDRLDALARVQGLLSRLNEHDRVTFDELLHTELAAMDGGSDRVSLKGPAGVRLRSSTVQTLAMALHELATNAMKDGALGEPEARLKVTWSYEPSGAAGKPWLHIDWRETGVRMRPPGSPPSGSGQGRELIERALPFQLGARTTYEVGVDGVHCTISVPVSASDMEPTPGKAAQERRRRALKD